MGLPQKVNIGSDFEGFPGGSFNALVDDYWQRKSNEKFPPQQRTTIPQFMALSVKNASGADVNPGYVLGLDDIVFNIDDDPSLFFSPPILKGITPTTAAHADRFCILRNFVADGQIGASVGVVLGLAAAYVEVSDAAHKFAKVKDGDKTCLVSATSGIPIIWKQSGTGSPAKKAIVFLGGSGATLKGFFAVVTTAIGARSGDTSDVIPGVGEAQFYSGAVGAHRMPSGSPATVYNYILGSPVPVGTPIYTTEADGGELIAADCGIIAAP